METISLLAYVRGERVNPKRPLKLVLPITFFEDIIFNVNCPRRTFQKHPPILLSRYKRSNPAIVGHKPPRMQHEERIPRRRVAINAPARTITPSRKNEAEVALAKSPTRSREARESTLRGILTPLRETTDAGESCHGRFSARLVTVNAHPVQLVVSCSRVYTQVYAGGARACMHRVGRRCTRVCT